MTRAERRRKLLARITDRDCRNVHFDEICQLLELYGFSLDRVNGSHHIFVHPDYQGIVNIARPHSDQNVKRCYCRDAVSAILEISHDE